MIDPDFTPCDLKAFLTLNEDPSYDPPKRVRSAPRIHRDRDTILVPAPKVTR